MLDIEPVVTDFDPDGCMVRTDYSITRCSPRERETGCAKETGFFFATSAFIRRRFRPPSCMGPVSGCLLGACDSPFFNSIA
jgi:hypothetical protein